MTKGRRNTKKYVRESFFSSFMATDNIITKAGVMALSEALKSNTTITQLECFEIFRIV